MALPRDVLKFASEFVSSEKKLDVLVSGSKPVDSVSAYIANLSLVV